MCSPRQLAPPSQAIENLYSTAGLHPPIAAPTATVARAFFVYGRCVCLRRRPKARSRKKAHVPWSQSRQGQRPKPKQGAKGRQQSSLVLYWISQQKQRVGTFLRAERPASGAGGHRHQQEKPSWSRLNNKIAAAAAATLPTDDSRAFDFCGDAYLNLFSVQL